MVQVTCPKSHTSPKTRHHLSHSLVPKHSTCPTHLSQNTALVPPTCPSAFPTCPPTSLTCPTSPFGGNCIQLDEVNRGGGLHVACMDLVTSHKSTLCPTQDQESIQLSGTKDEACLSSQTSSCPWGSHKQTLARTRVKKPWFIRVLGMDGMAKQDTEETKVCSSTCLHSTREILTRAGQGLPRPLGFPSPPQVLPQWCTSFRSLHHQQHVQGRLKIRSREAGWAWQARGSSGRQGREGVPRVQDSRTSGTPRAPLGTAWPGLGRGSGDGWASPHPHPSCPSGAPSPWAPVTSSTCKEGRKPDQERLGGHCHSPMVPLPHITTTTTTVQAPLRS
jgi:hypothetical protein